MGDLYEYSCLYYTFTCMSFLGLNIFKWLRIYWSQDKMHEDGNESTNLCISENSFEGRWLQTNKRVEHNHIIILFKLDVT